VGAIHLQCWADEVGLGFDPVAGIWLYPEVVLVCSQDPGTVAQGGISTGTLSCQQPDRAGVG
jgi:hypothetical protein